MTKDYDALVVGAGPNGLSAAITLQQQGLSVLLIEGSDEVGGLRSRECTLPGFVHDICSAIHPMAVASPFFNSLPLHSHGLNFVEPEILAAHPFDDGTAAQLVRCIHKTAASLGQDETAYLDLMSPILTDWPQIQKVIFEPLLRFPANPIKMMDFGFKAISSALKLSCRFKTMQAKGLWAGMATHSIQPLSKLTTSGIGLTLMAVGHLRGWPIVKGGSQNIARSLESYFLAIGGRVETGFYVSSLAQLPSSHIVMFDLTPKQLLKLAGHSFSSIYKWQLNRYRYGMGVYKVDWALADQIPFTSYECRKAGTVHVGNTIEEIHYSENLAHHRKLSKKPFVFVAQQSLFDETRAPKGKHTAWGYCHVPNGSAVDMTKAIENQIERFAPGFKDRILARHTMNSRQLEDYNPNYVGGDIGGGIVDIRQLFTRPVIGPPYNTSRNGFYMCSSSTPPGGGVHGMCGYNAAKTALKDIFKIQID